ncbi:Calcium-dependent protein kinase [Seminavis robusta]|uniref:Calcium-dependent protein kinase n=1 Tax=Seminavis robusta TaxID=568900 RepID=A0A9N8ES16_9STRA|nr:Calcium-dependent protein kinase [Seminavis robusta]|eukprot:Sro1618_g286420.1 Calcium-dependent protein kinase (546) ;mRNA; r:11200-13016
MNPSFETELNFYCSDEVESCRVDVHSPPAAPLRYPDPTFRAVRRSNILAIDHKSNQRHLVKALVRRRQSNSLNCGDIAYFLKEVVAKKPGVSKTWAAVVLRPTNNSRNTTSNESLFGVEWESTEQIVLIKVFPWQKLDRCQRQLVIQEASVLQYVGSSSEYVQGCLETLKDDQKVYIVMPHCSETTLASRIEPAADKASVPRDTDGFVQPNERLASSWFVQICKGLLHLQHKGLYHGGLCFESLFLVDNMALIVGDLSNADRVPFRDPFNAERVTDVSEGECRLLFPRDSSSKGDDRFRAPEITIGAFDAFASDIFSAGVVLFVLLTGIAPFKVAKTTDPVFKVVSSGHLRELLESWKVALSAEACDLLQSMLWRNPSKRLSLHEILEHPWMKEEKLRVPARVTYRALELPASYTGQKMQLLRNAIKHHKREQRCRELAPKLRRSLRLELLGRTRGRSRRDTMSDSSKQSWSSTSSRRARSRCQANGAADGHECNIVNRNRLPGTVRKLLRSAKRTLGFSGRRKTRLPDTASVLVEPMILSARSA